MCGEVSRRTLEEDVDGMGEKRGLSGGRVTCIRKNNRVVEKLRDKARAVNLVV
jgi:hypothetical protein